jgi:hypothetical protein
MQDRYAGDIGDFGKYALLKALAGSNLRLGVVWYLNPDEEENRDGEFIEYPELRECDESLYDRMQIFHRTGRRRIAGLEKAALLPDGTVFYTEPLTFRDLPPPGLTVRRQRREQWFEAAAAATKDADIVFLDPDNGFAPKSVSATAKSAQKYVFLDEASRFLDRDQSVVIYHHHARHESLPVQVERHFQALRAVGARSIWAFTFHRRTVRTFFVVAASRHKALLFDRSREFASTLWGRRGHFKLRTPMNELPLAIIEKHPKSDGAASLSSTPGSEVCETWDGQRWNEVGIDEALEIRRQHGSWPGGRCVECHEKVMPHKLGTTGQRAHFEHLVRNHRCSRASNRSGRGAV